MEKGMKPEEETSVDMRGGRGKCGVDSDGWKKGGMPTMGL